jgi:DegV family protein with EDD domain
MGDQIIADSGIDSVHEAKAEFFERVPFKITIDESEIIDLGLNIDGLLKRMKERTGKILTACPSPNDFIQAFQKHANTFIVTISSKLSGSYNSAVVAKNILLEENPENKSIHVFDSKSAGAGENLVALKIKQLIDEKLPFRHIVEETNNYISKLKTFFVIESLENLAKSGRITQMSALIGTALRISPIMGDNGEGEIELKARAYGKRGAFKKLIELIGNNAVDCKNTICGITHVNAEKKALEIKEELQRRFSFKDVLIFAGCGISTVYAGDGGIIVVF